ncbi:TPA: hypothetical protein N0F65_010276 [Lagenidium giganteum]|uniref:RING finger protein 141 n=1 Tax=Lagenidium giganteum TaxID=4803 RepID=A0AAV2YT29_9STRA|nr:TPA: hypothetical protein N0F65_010276 [Lagenidium giganteum]
MGQTTSSIPEDKMKKRIRQTMGSFVDLGTHLKQANEWARLCPTPKTCRLAFRIVVNDRISADMLPYLWRIRGNVYVEVRKVRRQGEVPTSFGAILPMVMGEPTQEAEEPETIGRARVLTVRQFYYIYCFLSDVKACAAHTVQPAISEAGDLPEFDEMECQICMDKKKQVVLPCTHSFCLYCFQHWTSQSKTCPTCRSKLDCSEGDELWQLMSIEVDDIGSYATDLVARIYEFLEKRDFSTFTPEDIERSADTYLTASMVKSASVSRFVYTDLLPTSLTLAMPTLARNSSITPEVDPTQLSDLMLAMELASGQDQAAAIKHYEQMRRDHVMAMTIAMQVEDEEDDPNEL